MSEPQKVMTSVWELTVKYPKKAEDSFTLYLASRSEIFCHKPSQQSLMSLVHEILADECHGLSIDSLEVFVDLRKIDVKVFVSGESLQPAPGINNLLDVFVDCKDML